MNLEGKSRQLTTLVLLSLIWGSSFILMKKGLESYSNLQLASLRMFFSFVFILPFTIRHFRALNKSNILSLIIVGYIGFGFPALLFATAQTRINSSLAGMLNSLTPLFTLLAGLTLYRTRARPVAIAGVLIGLAGATGLILRQGEHLFSGINGYAVYVVIATVFYGINANEVKNRLKDLSSIEITSLSFMFTGPVAGIYLLFTDWSPVVQTPRYLANLGYIAILALFSSVIAVLIFNHLIKYTTALFASSVTYIIPVVAILWGLTTGEAVGALQLACIAVILFGVYLVNR